MTVTAVVRMANQIAANVPDRSRAAGQTAAHLRNFWAPSMIDELQAEAHRYPTELSADVRAALEILRSAPD